MTKLTQSSGAPGNSQPKTSGSSSGSKKKWSKFFSSEKNVKRSKGEEDPTLSSGTVAAAMSGLSLVARVPLVIPLLTPGQDTQGATQGAYVKEDIFPTNILREDNEIPLEMTNDRLQDTHQLVLRLRLLKRTGTPSPTSPCTLTVAQLNWIQDNQNDPYEKGHLHCRMTQMVDTFIRLPSKSLDAIREIVLLGPVLDNEHYRNLLGWFLDELKDRTLFDIGKLQGLVHLVQCAPERYLAEDDLVKIMSILRINLQDTHRQSSVHLYHIMLALSRVLDAMTKHEIKDVDRLTQHVPLSEVLRELKDNSDPFLMYQASYAFQALQCIPDNETTLQAVMRVSAEVIEGVANISSIVNLDLGGFLRGLVHIQKTAVDVIDNAKKTYQGAKSLIQSGQEVVEAVKKGIDIRNKRAWYPAIVGANVMAQTGRLHDLKVVVMEAACRKSNEFQWGVCQLLGEIALDPKWETETRQQAVNFLVDLYTNDPNWGQDPSVKNWMVTILREVSKRPDEHIKAPPAFTRLYLDTTAGAHVDKSYPLGVYLSPPYSWPLLSKVQEVPFVERGVDLLKKRRLEQYRRHAYILPLAKASLHVSDKDALPLMDKVKEFLGNDQQVFLVLGDSGAGKSTFNRFLEYELWNAFKPGDAIPLFVNLPAIDRPDQDLVGKQLSEYTDFFSEAQIRELKQRRQMVLICDGYDETQLSINLHTSNKLNQKGQPNTKMIINCRSTYIGPNYKNHFQPESSDRYNTIAANLYTEAVIIPFSSDQIRAYVCQFVRDPEVHGLTGDRSIWSTDEYMDKLHSIPNLIELVKNPFLLTLSLRALPAVVNLAMVRVTRLALYKAFIDQWLEVNRLRLGKVSNLSDDAKKALKDILAEGFSETAIGFLKRLSAAIFLEQTGNPVVEFKPIRDRDTWKSRFFSPKPEIEMLRDSSPLSRTGNKYQFIHRSLLEYFYSRHIHEAGAAEGAVSTDSVDFLNHPLSHTDLVHEPSIIQFLAEHVQGDSVFEQFLRQIIEQSKKQNIASQAAANALTILVRAGIRFHGADLRGIRVPGADLSYGDFDSAQLQGADLRNTILRSVWLHQADLSDSQMEGVVFGQWPYLEEDDIVSHCAFSPDGENLAVGLHNGGFSVYNTSTWSRVDLQGHACTVSSEISSTTSDHSSTDHPDNISDVPKDISSVSYSPCGQQIVFGSRDGTIRLCDARAGALISMWIGHTDRRVTSVACSPDGQQIASGSSDSIVRLWDAQTGAPRFNLSGHTDRITSVAYSPNGRQIASGSDDKTVRLWDTRTGALSSILSDHTDSVNSVACSPNNQQVASGSDDQTVRLWDARMGALTYTLSGHTGRVTSVAFSSNGQQIASGSADETVRLWDAQTGAPISILCGHTDAIVSVAYSSSTQQIASGGYDRTVRLWDSQTDTHGFTLSNHTDGVLSVKYSPCNRSIASGSKDKTVRVWDAQTGALNSTLCGHTEGVNSVAFSPNGQQIASGSKDTTIRLWDAQTDTISHTLRGHTDYVASVAYSPNGQQIASASDDKTVLLWDALAGTLSHTLRGHTDYVMCVTYSPDGQQIASSSVDRTVRLWDARTGAPGCILRGDSYWTTSVVFSPNGQQIASGSSDGTVRLWDVKTGACSSTLNGHSGTVNSVVYSPSGKLITSSSSDKTARLWDADSGQCLFTLDGFQQTVHSIAWNAAVNDTYFVAACEDNSISAWKVEKDGTDIRVGLHWRSGPNKLVLSNASIQRVQGLSETDMRLFQQQKQAVDQLVTGVVCL